MVPSSLNNTYSSFLQIFLLFYSPVKGVKVWIKIFILEYDMRGYQGLKAIIRPFGNLLDLDFNTRIHFDLRFARVYVDVATLELIPPFLWFEVNRLNGWVSYVKIYFQIDEDMSSSSQHLNRPPQQLVHLLRQSGPSTSDPGTTPITPQPSTAMMSVPQHRLLSGSGSNISTGIGHVPSG
jgi:hypothetical protein